MHTIEIIDDLMCVMDGNGDGYDCHVLDTLVAALAQIDAWTSTYTFDVDDARKQANGFFSDRDEE
jgi:hypothetical protein